ncbi:Gametocyte-specific factor 1 [Camponotus floridanus]|uniref:Gametocyte-specific factor 1 n=1 Tax=Camponotus floridanus TaxID=104421 RepID=E2AX74_CAMFO|nr:uncharacterized protein LOC105256949 [Camponotus floridanus]EFN61957.1 Gametocyte-specific factor 1 [Camponotus floridanus]
MFSSDSDVVRCPYNKHHTVPRLKFQRHLVKCEKNYPPDYKVLCPYNATHRLSKSEIEEHINTCPMRNTVEASYIPPRTYDMLSEKYKYTSEINSDVFSESQEEMENLSKISFNSKLRNQTNGFIKGHVESFINTMNIGQSSLMHRYDNLNDEAIGDDMESIASSIGQGRMSNTDYHRRFKMREGKK